MKYLTILNKINTYMLGVYFASIVIDLKNIAFPEYDQGLLICTLILFLTTFVCGGLTLHFADRAVIEFKVTLDDIRLLPKRFMIITGLLCTAEMIFLFRFIDNQAVIWAMIVLPISYGFVIAEKIFIPRITESVKYKLSMPVYLYALPPTFFLVGEFYVADLFGYDENSIADIVVFAISTVMLILIVLRRRYIIDEEKKCIIEVSESLSDLKDKKEKIDFSAIQYIECRRYFYIVRCRTKEIKISRIYSGTKKFRKTMEENGIEIIVKQTNA